MKIFIALIYVGCLFSLLAAIAAFVISYEEWSHHFPGGKEPLWHALQAAVVTFVVLTVLITVAIYGIAWLLLSGLRRA